jgi:hypothetical protein
MSLNETSLSLRVLLRYKTLDEQRAERRSYFTEKEIPIDVPLAPPRQKRHKEKRMSVKDFREENRQTLFQSDHQTEEGHDLLPVGRKIAFDCPLDPESGARSEKDVHVSIDGPDGRKCRSDVVKFDEYGFTSEFMTSVVGRHNIEIVIAGNRLNVTPDFYTYDASKIRVGDMPPGYTGMPVDFQGELNILFPRA